MKLINLTTIALVSGLSLAVTPAWSEQICNPNVTATTPSSDFTAHGDGTVTHHKTGLMWKVCSEGQTFKMDNGVQSCTGDGSKYNWKDALAHAENATFANYSDWRLPNINELTSILELKCKNLAINENVFPNTPPFSTWTSSTYANGNSYAWGVYFSPGYGRCVSKSYNKYVRLVRTP